MIWRRVSAFGESNLHFCQGSIRVKGTRAVKSTTFKMTHFTGTKKAEHTLYILHSREKEYSHSNDLLAVPFGPQGENLKGKM